MTHDELTQAITAARNVPTVPNLLRCDTPGCDECGGPPNPERDALLDLCAAILDLHRPTTTDHACHAGCHGRWPCASVGLVESALRGMGVGETR